MYSALEQVGVSFKFLAFPLPSASLSQPPFNRVQIRHLPPYVLTQTKWAFRSSQSRIHWKFEM
ncbi:hypothetical protein BDR03DRAFT_951507, partial [Suillus americanus]